MILLMNLTVDMTIEGLSYIEVIMIYILGSALQGSV